MNQLSTANFSYDKNTGIFTAEASDLPESFVPCQIYPDACDSGFHLVSHVTGREIKMVEYQIDKEDGDIQGWWYQSIDRKYDGIKVLIIND